MATAAAVAWTHKSIRIVTCLRALCTCGQVRVWHRSYRCRLLNQWYQSFVHSVTLNTTTEMRLMARTMMTVSSDFCLFVTNSALLFHQFHRRQRLSYVLLRSLADYLVYQTTDHASNVRAASSPPISYTKKRPNCVWPTSTLQGHLLPIPPTLLLLLNVDEKSTIKIKK